MNHRLLALYGLKWNPFSAELPIEALFVPPRIENFCWRIEHAQIREGGFAMIHGDPGTGKSVALRLLDDRLRRLSDVTVGAIPVDGGASAGVVTGARRRRCPSALADLSSALIGQSTAPVRGSTRSTCVRSQRA